MSTGDIKEYLIDVAASSQYQNQTDEYYREYTKWRIKENNRYGYKFIKDTREHTYAFGEGFENSTAKDAERETLRNISYSLGVILLISAFIRLAQAIFDSRAGHILSGAAIELTGQARQTDVSSAVILSMFRPVSLITCIILFQMFLRLPRKVALPSNRKIPKRHLFCMLGICAGVATVCYVFSVFADRALGTAFFSVTGGFVWCDDMGLNIYYFAVQYILAALLQAVFINGFVMQTLRQFGDAAALFMSTLVEGIMAVSLMKISTHLVMGIIFGMIALKTGSVWASFGARVMTNVLFFIYKFIRYYSPPQEREIYTILICITILALALFCLGRLMGFDDYDLTIEGVRTELQFYEKASAFFVTLPMIAWYAAAAVAWLYIMVA